MLFWSSVDQPPGYPPAPTDTLRERRLLLIGKEPTAQGFVAYDGFGRELETYVLGLQPGGRQPTYKRVFTMNLRQVTNTLLTISIPSLT